MNPTYLLKNLITQLFLLSLAASYSFAAPIKVIFSPSIEGVDKDGLGEFVRDYMESSLTDQADIELLDRSKFYKSLNESVIGDVQSSDVASQLKVSGAEYSIYPKITSFQEHIIFTFKIVNVKTTSYRSEIIKTKAGDNPIDTASKATQKIVDGLKVLSENKLVEKPSYDQWTLAKGKPRFKVAIRIPETSSQQEAADPAGEKELSSILLKSKFTLIQLSRPSQSTTPEKALHLEGKEYEDLIKECQLKGVEVLILGIAISDRATRIGSYNVGAARIELAAVRVRDSKVLASAKGYGKASDISDLIAEKKSIENAVQRIAPTFIEDMVEQ